MDYQKTAASYLPAEAGGLERQVAAALFEQQHVLRESLSMDSISDNRRGEYERRLRKASDDLRALRDSVYRRISE